MELKEFYHNAYMWLISHGVRVVIAIIVLLIGLKIIKWLGIRIRGRMSTRKVHSSLQPFFLSLAITGLYIALIVWVLVILNFDLAVFGTILGGFTVAVGLALSGTFQNFAGGVLILLLKPFELDDNIIAQGQDGIVTSIQLFYTVLLTGDNRTIIIPNGKLFNEVIINVTREGKRRLDFELKLGYIVDVEQVKKIIDEAIKATKGIIRKPEPIVGVYALEIDGIRFTVRVWVNPNDYFDVKLFLQEKIVKDLRNADVKLPTHHLLPGT